jgi:hypothetical protein
MDGENGGFGGVLENVNYFKSWDTIDEDETIDTALENWQKKIAEMRESGESNTEIGRFITREKASWSFG